jgi:tripartite-type tricarboxylate transporter receptor subunit TctC
VLGVSAIAAVAARRQHRVLSVPTSIQSRSKGKLMQRRTVLTAAVAATSLLVAGVASAQAYPNKPVRLIVPFAPGGTTDIVARVVAERINQSLGQSMLVENKAGGGGSVGATEISRAAPDGYTIGMATVSTTAANPAINPKIAYNPITDFTPIINVAATPNVIAVHPSFPAKDYKGFIAALKASPGKYSYASSGTGGIGHLQMELFKNLSGTFVTHIPYRGAGPALNDTVAGQVPMIFDNLPSALPFIKDGRLIPIVVAAPNRLAVLPNVPTFKEVGLEPVNRMAYYGIHGPKGMPREIVDKVAGAVKKTLEDPSVKKRIEDTGSLIIANTPEQFAAQIQAEFNVYKDVVDKQKLKLD